MQFFYYSIFSDLVSVGLMFLLYFTCFAIFALLIAINFRYRNNRSSTLLKNIMKPFLYRIPNHVDYSLKFIDFIEYESFKRLIYRVEEIEEIKKSFKKRGGQVSFQNKLLPSILRDRGNEGEKYNIPKRAGIGRDGGVGKVGTSVDENKWRGFTAPSIGASTGVMERREREESSGRRYEDMKRKKRE